MRKLALVVMAACVALPVAAQDDVVVNDRMQHASVLYQGGRLLMEQYGGEWTQERSLRAYGDAHAGMHGGNFVLFRGKDGAIHDLNDAKAVEALQVAWAPMKALSERQKELSAPQHSLGEEQKALGAQMRAASSPEEMAALGRQQGALGREQGAIGRQQGEVGRQQGEIGRKVQIELDRDIDRCMAAHSCPVVEDAAI